MSEPFLLHDYTIVPVDDRRTRKAFVDFPYAMYRNNDRWIPPLRKDERRRWDTRYNASLMDRLTKRFLALRGDTIVGRIAAIDDPSFDDRWEADTGLFGFFECEDDPTAAQQLLRSAEDFLRTCGKQRVVGPVNLTAHDETGLLVNAFDEPPMIQSPYNPPYYPRLLTDCGYRPFRDYHAYVVASTDRPNAVVQRLARAAGRHLGTAGAVTIRPLDMSRWDHDIKIIFDLYNSSFSDVWGFVPISWDEFLQRAAMFRSFVIPELVPIAELEGQAVGFAVMLPDVNAALAKLNGRLWPFGWLKLMRRVPRLDTGRFMLLGVRPNLVGRGIGALLALETQKAARQTGIKSFELSLVQATNDRVRRIIDAWGASVVKTYRLYDRNIPITTTSREHAA